MRQLSFHFHVTQYRHHRGPTCVMYPALTDHVGGQHGAVLLLERSMRRGAHDVARRICCEHQWRRATRAASLPALLFALLLLLGLCC